MHDLDEQQDLAEQCPHVAFPTTFAALMRAAPLWGPSTTIGAVL